MQDMKQISARTELLLRVAWEYHVNHRTERAIARMYGVSPASVSRLLASARRQGYVRVSVALPEGVCLELEDRLCQAFDLAFAYVVPQADHEAAQFEALGRAAAFFLSRHAHDWPTIAVGWGRTVSHIPRHIPADIRLPDSKAEAEVVEMVGAFSTTSSPLRLLRVVDGLAERLRRTAKALPAPAVAPDVETRDALLRHEPILDVLRHARQADLAIVSLGTANSHSTLYQLGLLTENDLGLLRAQGAAGEILGRFFDGSGAPLPSPFHDRLIGLTLEDLRALPRVLIVAGGEGKREALLAALRSRLATHLVTDDDTARWVLEHRDT
ncbi:MAG: sugar-binding transcriptional regulator [Firmicutes bacterium]|nr:sugar-binding transcriptional regulator [Bacillota bacterium]